MRCSWWSSPEELGEEEGVALGLLEEERGEGGRGRGGDVQGVGAERGDVCEPERLEGDGRHLRARGADRVQGAPQRVGGAHLVVPVGADQAEVGRARAGQEVLDEDARGCVGPLQVVEEDDQGVLRGGERAEQLAEGEIEPVLRLARADRDGGWLLAHHQLDGRDQLGEDRRVRPDRSEDALAPDRQGGLALGEDLLEQVVERVAQGGVGHVPLELVELARGEVPAGAEEGPVDLVHQRGLADAGIALDQDQLSLAGGGALDGGAHGGALALAAVELLGDLEALRDVTAAGLETHDVPVGRQVRAARLEIRGETLRALVAILGVLGEEAHDHRRDSLRDGRVAEVRGRRLDGDVRVNQLERVVRGEGGAPVSSS